MTTPQTKRPRRWPAAWTLPVGGFQAIWVFVLWAMRAVWALVLAGLGVGLSSKASSSAAAVAPPTISRVFANPPKQVIPPYDS